MEIKGISYTPNFGTKISKNIMPLIARAKGTCPLHKKPLLYDAIKTIETLFPDRTIMRNNNEIHFPTIGFWSNHIVLTKVTGNAVDDVRAIASKLEWLKIGVRKYSPLTNRQKIAVENFHKKWGAFMEKRNKTVL